jgi:hypothetical protein
MRETSSPTSQQMLAAWSLCCLLAALIFMAYAGASLATGRGEFILPLDDSYIHFQYARQIANGQPYIYNPGDPPTSGATSFLYPYLLTAGYALGFRGLDLGLWAVGIGALGLAFSTWLVYRLGRVYSVAQPLALLAALAFAVTGSISWHFMNGMETGLIITLTLLTLYMITRRDYRGFVIAAALLALSRPEGSIMTVIAVGFLGLRSWRTGQRSQLPWLGIPLLAVGVQPLLNLLLTGSLSASGSSAKSIFGTIPFHLDAALGRVFEQFSQMWLELATGTGGLHTPLIIPPLALVGLIFLLASRERRLPGLLLIIWLLAVTAAVSTLDTAFWHFKRYQMPLFALLYPLAAWGAQSLIDRTTHRLTLPRLRGVLPAAAGVVMLLAALPGAVEYLRLYVVNVRNITVQPLPMARWLAQHTPADAVIAVHDVGMMRYLGERYTVDMVGLTTPGAADAWRNGPGAVAAFLYRHDPRPEYIAAYTTARGLNYLADTGIYGELLAGFTAEYRPEDNVALGAEFQGIYRADWAAMERAAVPLQPSTQRYVNGLDLIATINVADLISEAPPIMPGTIPGAKRASARKCTSWETLRMETVHQSWMPGGASPVTRHSPSMYSPARMPS